MNRVYVWNGHRDSAYRFFLVQRDVEFGWRLHLADLSTNKVLALAGRWEARDFVDTLYLDDSFASLGLLAWAAAGKDPGLTPALILEQANRFKPSAARRLFIGPWHQQVQLCGDEGPMAGDRGCRA